MNQIIRNAFECALKARGFAKKSGSWYLEQPETVLVANLQKSQYGDQYYVNLAVAVKRLSSERFPKEHHCHVRVRLETLCDPLVQKALDGEDQSIPDERRYALIDAAKREHGLPLLDACASIDGITQTVANGQLEDALVHKDVRPLID
jgi:hypothetical protein